MRIRWGFQTRGLCVKIGKPGSQIELPSFSPGNISRGENREALAGGGMTDLYSRERRSEIMSRIRAKDTAPKCACGGCYTRWATDSGCTVRTCRGSRTSYCQNGERVIHVHGCFWHGHTCCEGRIPKTNRRYWTPKLKRNTRRDSENSAELRRLGWNQIIIWECETGSVTRLKQRWTEDWPGPSSRQDEAGWLTLQWHVANGWTAPLCS